MGNPKSDDVPWTNQGWAADVEMMLQETLGKGERSGVTVQGSGMARALWASENLITYMPRNSKGGGCGRAFGLVISASQ